MTINTNAPEYVKNQKLIQWVADVAALTKPDNIRWCDAVSYTHLTLPTNREV